MSNNNLLKLLGILICLLAADLTASGQRVARIRRPREDTFRLVVYAGGGISYFTGLAGTPAGLQATVDYTNQNGMLRLMWHPGYLIRVGLETGWVPFYSYEVTSNGFKGKASVRAIPILFVFSMPVGRRFHFFSGTGSYLMQTQLDYRGKITSSDHSLGYMLAASYVQPLTKRLGIGIEGKWMDAVGTKDAVLSAQLQLRWGMSMRKQPSASGRAGR